MRGLKFRPPLTKGLGIVDVSEELSGPPFWIVEIGAGLSEERRFGEQNNADRVESTELVVPVRFDFMVCAPNIIGILTEQSLKFGIIAVRFGSLRK